jgi:hypothetical protein
MILLLVMGMLCIPDRVVTREQREQALQQKCIENLENLAVTCLKYAQANNGKFPADNGKFFHIFYAQLLQCLFPLFSGDDPVRNTQDPHKEEQDQAA